MAERLVVVSLHSPCLQRFRRRFFVVVSYLTRRSRHAVSSVARFSTVVSDYHLIVDVRHACLSHGPREHRFRPPDDAEVPSMPLNAMRRGEADYVLPAAEMPRVIMGLLMNGRPVRTGSGAGGRTRHA